MGTIHYVTALMAKTRERTAANARFIVAVYKGVCVWVHNSRLQTTLQVALQGIVPTATMKKTQKYNKQTMIRVYVNSMTSCRFLSQLWRKNQLFLFCKWPMAVRRTYVCVRVWACMLLAQAIYVYTAVCCSYRSIHKQGRYLVVSAVNTYWPDDVGTHVRILVLYWPDGRFMFDQSISYHLVTWSAD